jgi:ATP-dependent DNA helicase RecG
MVLSLIKCTIGDCINEYIKTDRETKTSGDNTGMRTEELDQILQKGEGQFVEFKENLDNSLAKEIVAFSNASGGRILLGINDKNKVTGVSITNRLKSQIMDIANNCDPKISLHFEEMENILIINVPEGNNKPYQCAKGFFLRLGPNSQKLTRDEILKFSIRENAIRFDEQICFEFDFKDFDDDKFEYYLKLARISKILDRDDMLKNLRVLTNYGMTNAGVLFFAKSPYKYIFASKIRCVLFKGNERLDILDKKEVDKGIIGNIEFANTYLKEHVPVRFEIKGMKGLLNRIGSDKTGYWEVEDRTKTD